MMETVDVASPSVDETDLWTLAVFRLAQVGMLVANLGRVPVFSTGDREAPLTINEMLLALVLAVGLLAVVQRRKLRIDGVATTALAFALVGAGSAFMTAQRYDLTAFELAVSLAYLGRWLFYFALYIVLQSLIDRRRVLSLWSAVETMLLCIAVFGILQAAFLPNFAQLVYPDSRAAVDWDVQGHRLVSTLLDPNVVGSMLAAGALIQLSLISAGASVRRWRVLTMLVALVLTVSRSAALAFFAGMIVIFVARGLSRRLLRVLGFLALLAAAALPKLIELARAFGRFDVGAGTSAGERVLAWLRALQVFRDHPIFGVGFNTYGYVVEHYGWPRFGVASYGSDGGLLFIAALTGIVGLALYCLILLLVIRNCQRIWRDPSAPAEHRGLAIGTAAATVAVVVDSMFVNTILTTNVMELMWVMWAIVGILSARPHRILESAVAKVRLVALRV
jgi:putative inorganic carbon (hco3(-)) transporter